MPAKADVTRQAPGVDEVRTQPLQGGVRSSKASRPLPRPHMAQWLIHRRPAASRGAYSGRALNPGMRPVDRRGSGGPCELLSLIGRWMPVALSTALAWCRSSR